MTEREFMDLVEARHRKRVTLMQAKSGEYSRNDDKLHNFYRAAELQGCTPERALQGMWAKHLVSILDIVDDTETYMQLPSQSVIEEKFNDCHNYLDLLEALIKERRDDL